MFALLVANWPFCINNNFEIWNCLDIPVAHALKVDGVIYTDSCHETIYLYKESSSRRRWNSVLLLEQTFWGRRRRRRVSVNRQVMRGWRWSPVKNLHDNNISMNTLAFLLHDALQAQSVCLSVRPSVHHTAPLDLCRSTEANRQTSWNSQRGRTLTRQHSLALAVLRVPATNQPIWQHLRNDTAHGRKLPQTTNWNIKRDLSKVYFSYRNRLPGKYIGKYKVT